MSKERERKRLSEREERTRGERGDKYITKILAHNVDIILMKMISNIALISRSLPSIDVEILTKSGVEPSINCACKV